MQSASGRVDSARTFTSSDELHSPAGPTEPTRALVAVPRVEPARASRVLIADPEPVLAHRVQALLERRNHDVKIVSDYTLISDALETHDPDLVIVDLDLPGGDGLRLFDLLRARSAYIVALSPNADGDDRAVVLERGADDIVPSPTSPREIAARVNALLRRGQVELRHRASDADAEQRLVLDEPRRQVVVDGTGVRLTAIEMRLLMYLARRPREVVGRDELLEQVWGYTIGDRSTVTVHIRRLRAKIERDPSHPTSIRTVWGAGYCFDPEDACSSAWAIDQAAFTSPM